MNTSDLAALEQRTYRASFDHGLIDLLLGGYLVILGLILSLELFHQFSGLVGGLTGGFAFPLGWWLRKRLVEPRLGYVRLTPARRARLRWGPCVAAVIMAAIILLGIWISGRAAEFAVFPGFIPAMVFAAPIAACGYFLELRRMYGYGAILLLERMLDASWGQPFEWLYWPSGLIIAGTGLFVMNRFLRHYPLPTGADADA